MSRNYDGMGGRSEKSNEKPLSLSHSDSIWLLYFWRNPRSNKAFINTQSIQLASAEPRLTELYEHIQGSYVLYIDALCTLRDNRNWWWWWWWCFVHTDTIKNVRTANKICSEFGPNKTQRTRDVNSDSFSRNTLILRNSHTTVTTEGRMNTSLPYAPHQKKTPPYLNLSVTG